MVYWQDNIWLQTRPQNQSFYIFFFHSQIECTAKIHDLYEKRISKSFEEDRPQVYSPSLSYLSEEEYNLRNGKSALHMQHTDNCFLVRQRPISVLALATEHTFRLSSRYLYMRGQLIQEPLVPNGL